MANVTPHSDAPARRNWIPLNVGTALALAVILSLLAFLLTSTGESPVTSAAESQTAEQLADDGQLPAPITEPAETSPGTAVASLAEEPDREVVGVTETTIPAAADSYRAFAGGEDAAYSVVAMGRELTNLGPTEVGFVTNFPLVDYEWQRIEVAAGGYDMGWLGELGDKLVAVSPVWNEGEEGGSQRLVTSVSTDGIDWVDGGSYDLDQSEWVSRVVSDGSTVYAFVNSWDEATGVDQHLMLTSQDGIGWTEVVLDLGAEANEHVYIQAATAGSAGLFMAASFESYPEEQPSLLEFEEFNVELDHRTGTYTLIDRATGDTVLSGQIDEIYAWGGSGQPIYDPESGELLTTVPWEVWEEGFNTFYSGYGYGSPLPVPVNPVEPQEPPVITIEYDGLTIVVDEYAYEFSVTDAQSGELVASGSLDYVYQGPPPRFVDPDSGEVLLSVTWDEWYKAEELSYRHYESEYHDYTSRTALMTSADGQTWESTSIPTRYGAHVSSAIPTDTGFVALVNSYGEFGDKRGVWSFANGEWTSEEGGSSELWLHQVVRTPNGYIGVGDGAGGPAIWASDNALDWASEFAIVPQDDGSWVYMAAVAVDESGMVGALANREKWTEYQPLVMEADGYTLTFEDGETAVRVTDAGGETVLALDWYAFEDETDVVTWEDGVTYFDLGNGDIVAIPDEDVHAAMDSRWADQGTFGLSVFLKEGSSWSEAIVDFDGGLNGASQLYMIDGKIIIGGTYWESGPEVHHSEFGGQGTFVIMVGTPVGG